MTRHVAIYCRISVDRAGRKEGVKAQERAGRAYAAQHWPELPVEVYADNDLSAANGGPRPEFDRLREAVRAGQVTHLWVVEQSRLERTEVGWFELAAELDAAGITELHTNRDGVVRVRDEVSGILAVIAAGEARRLQQRTKDKLAANAAAGIPPPSRPYGFCRATTPDGVSTYEHEPEQVTVVRDVAQKVLAGWSLTSIAAHLDAAGIRGARGSRLNTTTVRSMVTTPAVASKRLHQGRIIGDGNWPPILDEAIWRACRDKLAAPRIVHQPDGRTYPVPAPGRRSARRYLLTGGVAVCAICGARIIGTLKPTTRHGPAVPYYVCGVKYGGRGCIGIQAEPTERHVLGEIMRALATPAFVAQLATDDHAERRDQLNRELEDVEDQREELARMWADGTLNSAEWVAARDRLTDREVRLRGELADVPPPLGNVNPAALTDPRVWEAMMLGERRELLGLFVERVVIDRARPPYTGFQPGRVTVVWRTR